MAMRSLNRGVVHAAGIKTLPMRRFVRSAELRFCRCLGSLHRNLPNETYRPLLSKKSKSLSSSGMAGSFKMS